MQKRFSVLYQMVFCFQNWSDLLWEKLCLWSRKMLISLVQFIWTELIVAIKMPIRKKYLECRNLHEQVGKKNVITLSKNIFLEFSTNLLTDSFPMMKRRTLASSKVGSSPSSAPPPSSSAFSEKKYNFGDSDQNLWENWNG